MFGIKGSYSDLWKAIIRPPRDVYNVKDLGPTEFRVAGKKVKRTDIQLKNDKGLKLECSHFEPVKRPCKELPCVIYMHGNSSSRMESLNCLSVLIPQNITLFSLDFSGSGLSEGEYISLGWYERDDIATIVDYLRKSERTSTIGLWGRSMGAVTALMHADRDPSIAGLVLDSPFSSLRQLAEDLCKSRSSIPKFVMNAALMFIKSTIKDKAKFDIDNLNPLENHVKSAFINALFVAANDDTFIEPKHTKALYDAYAGDKNLIMVEGDHNSQRPQFMLDSVAIFFYNTLQVEQLVPLNGEYIEEEDKSKNKKLQDKNSNNNLKNIDDFAKKNRRIGNEELVREALGCQPNDDEDDAGDNNNNDGFFDEDEDNLRRAIEESLKVSQQQSQQQGKPKKIVPKQNSFQPRGDDDQEMFHEKEEEQKLEDYFIEDNGINNDSKKQQQQNQQYQKQENYNDLLQLSSSDSNNEGNSYQQSTKQQKNSNNGQYKKGNENKPNQQLQSNQACDDLI